MDSIILSDQRITTPPSIPGLDFLLTGVALAESILLHAVYTTRHSDPTPNHEFRGLFIDEAAIDRLLHQPHVTSSSSKELEEIATARQRWQASCRNEANAQSPLAQLIHRFGLTPLQTEILLLALLPELESRYGQFFAYLQDDVTRKRPSIHLILTLLTPSMAKSWAARCLLVADSYLRQQGLIESDPPPSQPNAPLQEHMVSLAPTIVHFLLGYATLDAAYTSVARLTHSNCETDSPRHVSSVQMAQIEKVCNSSERPPLFVFIGEYGAGKQEAAARLAAVNGRSLLSLSLPNLAISPIGLQEGMKRILRDGVLHSAVLYLQGWQTLLQDGQPPAVLWQQLLAYPQAIIVTSQHTWQPQRHGGHRPIYTMHFSRPDYQTRLQTWQHHLGTNGSNDHFNLPQLANLFRLSAGQIEDSVATAKNLARWQQRDLTRTDLYTAAQLHSNQQLSTLGTKITPRYRWHDIVLPEDTLAQLKEIAMRLRHQATVFDSWGYGDKLAYGKGLAALFVGESGTGKTMAADIIAGELGLDLYRIDLSSVVSKYIGETEKNLERIFSEATTSNAILFFDEADALFGKRGDVKDSHDRYANLEVSYLLQRVEQFEGITILASNLQANIDEAFVRRLSFIIEFPLPDRAEREKIWHLSIPEATPLAADIAFEQLANFKLTGGNIRSITLAAAFLAAETGCLQMHHLLHATRREYQKLGRLFDEPLLTAEAAL